MPSDSGSEKKSASRPTLSEAQRKRLTPVRAKPRKAKASDSAEEGRAVALRRIGSRVAVAVLFLALGVGWVVGLRPLQKHVGAIAQERLPGGAAEIVVQWPRWPKETRPKGVDARATWLPQPVREDVLRIAAASLSTDPFDQSALERARTAVEGTGWMTDAKVQRRADGTIDIRGDWRAHAAVVRHQGKEYLVALGGELLRAPPAGGVPVWSTLYVVASPYAGPPTREGELAYGKPWEGGDVQEALELLTRLSQVPETDQVTGVDLSDFMSKGRLLIMTDTGSRIVWGSPIGETAPGEISVDKKLARLKQNRLDFGRIDAGQPRLAIYTPFMLMDATAGNAGE